MSFSRQRVTNALFNQRFLLGVYVPLILEFLVFAIYTALRGIKLDVTWLIYLVIWVLIFLAPALFFYIVSPMFIYFICGIGKEYETSLKKNIDSLSYILAVIVASLDIESRSKESILQARYRRNPC